MKISNSILAALLSAPIFAGGCTNYSQSPFENLSSYQRVCPKITEFDDGDQILDDAEAKEYANFLLDTYGVTVANSIAANLTHKRYNMTGWPFYCEEITPADNILRSADNLKKALQEHLEQQKDSSN